MSKHGRFEKPRDRKKTLPVVLAILAAVLLISCVGGVIFYNNVLNKISRAQVIDKSDATVDPALLGNMEETTYPTLETTAPPETEPTVVETTEHIASPEDILNVLVVGQAARAGEEHRLADTMVLVSVNKFTKEVTLTSFLRDTYVDMPDYMGKPCGWNRINLVYHLGWTWGDTGGAMEMMNMCLKNNFGIEVDYNIEVDFEAFTKIIDVLGGVRIDLTEAEANYINRQKKDYLQEVTPGENRLFGDTALEYARMRKATGDGDSDIKRTARQRTLITAILEKLRYKGMDVLMELADEVLPLITTNMTNSQITKCLMELLPILPDMTISTGTCPVETTYWGEMIELGGYPASVLKFDQGQNIRLMKAITEGVTE